MPDQEQVTKSAPCANPHPYRDTNSDEALANRYDYHPPMTDERRRAHEEIRAKVLETAKYIRDRTPKSPEQTRVFNALDDAMFCANAALARHVPQQ